MFHNYVTEEGFQLHLNQNQNKDLRCDVIAIEITEAYTFKILLY